MWIGYHKYKYKAIYTEPLERIALVVESGSHISVTVAHNFGAVLVSTLFEAKLLQAVDVSLATLIHRGKHN